MAAMNELAFLVLTPFCQIPRVEFDGVRLGKTAVRKVVVQNPGKKPIKVCGSSNIGDKKDFCLIFVTYVA